MHAWNLHCVSELRSKAEKGNAHTSLQRNTHVFPQADISMRFGSAEIISDFAQGAMSP